MEDEHRVCHWQRSVQIHELIDIHLVSGRRAWRLLGCINKENQKSDVIPLWLCVATPSLNIYIHNRPVIGRIRVEANGQSNDRF